MEGALVEEGASAVGTSYTYHIAVGSVSEGGQTPVLDYSGGVFHSELTVCICRSFGGFESIYEAHLPRAHLVYLDLYFSLDQAAIVSGSSIFCTYCIPPSTC